MPARRTWTTDQDDTIKRMRASGSTWQAIADVLGIPRDTIIERGRRIRAVGGPEVLRKAKPEIAGGENRPPLPAGHPVTWGILTRGTMLEGTAWPRR